MWRDPIVEEVRRHARRMQQLAGDDLHRYCEMLRDSQEKRGAVAVTRGGTRTTRYPPVRHREALHVAEDGGRDRGETARKRGCGSG
jgi:hypothetical protein